ncbi:DoxX family protein [Ekhidna sp.]|uniref:DoxX family protein n=1 Tax=Ekhidna sp. TaxID=2608089 RepID=UPI00329A2F3C
MKTIVNHKLFISLGLALVFLGAINLVYKLFDIIESRTNWEFAFWEHDFLIQLVVAAIGFFLGALFTLRNQGVRSQRIHEAIIFLNCVWLAIFIAHAGLSKILDDQFNVQEQIKDMPLMEVHPSALTWYYFGLFYQYGLIIGITQTLGSLFLLFGRTRLLGAAILTPVMLNIVLANHFFLINKNAYVLSVLLTTGLVYILLIDYEKLIACFISSSQNLVSSIWKSALRIGAIITVISIQFLFVSSENESFLKGVYKVENIQSNDSTLLYSESQNMRLSKVYFEYHTTNRATLEYGNHHNRTVVKYQLDTISNNLSMNIGDSWLDFSYVRLDDEIIKLEETNKETEMTFDLIKIRDATK